MKKILITGGSGFLGRNLATKLKENYEVINNFCKPFGDIDIKSGRYFDNNIVL